MGKLSVSSVNNPAVEMYSYLNRLLLELTHENHLTIPPSFHKSFEWISIQMFSQGNEELAMTNTISMVTLRVIVLFFLLEKEHSPDCKNTA